jgi:subtilisin family serine protease
MKKHYKQLVTISLTLILLSQSVITLQINSAKAENNTTIPQLSNASIPTEDSYDLSEESFDLTMPNKIITFTDWQTGFSINTDNTNNLDGISFRFKYSDNSYSKLFKISPNTEDLDIEGQINSKIFSSELYTSVKVLKQVEFFYSQNNAFNINQYPINKPTTVSTLSVSDSAKVAYKKEFMNKIGVAIYTRDEWGAPTTSSETFSTTGINRIVVHHTATSVNMADPKLTVKAIYDYHNCSITDYYAGLCNNGGICCDIGYNYLIDPYGNIYEGRSGPVRVRGAHAIPNSGSIGISMMGNFQNEQPTQAAFASLIRLTAGLSQIYGIDLEMVRDFETGAQKGLEGHKDVIGFNDTAQAYTPVATACPGTHLYSQLSAIRTAATDLAKQDSMAKTAYEKMITMTSKENVVINNGYAEIILNKATLDSVVNPKNYTTNDLSLWGIKILDEHDGLITIGVDQSQYKQYIAEILLTNPESKIQPNYQYTLNTIDTNDTYKNILWGLDNFGQPVNGTSGTNDADVDAPEAWNVTEGTSNDVIVAVIDTGVAYNHPDLSANMWDGSNCVDEENVTIIGGCLHGYDYMNTDNNPLPSPLDSSGYRNHGTHIAGIIGAERNNSKGIVGIAPKVQIMAIKSSFNTASILKEVNFAKNNGAKIINASWAGSGGFTCDEVNDQYTYNAFKDFPGLIVVAAGNSNKNHNLSTYFNFPSDFGHTTSCWTGLDNVISVGASDQSDNKASFSDYGSAIDITAPGSNIYSTTDNTVYEAYGFMSGTSMATPQVAGLAAYIWSKDINQSTNEIKNTIINGGDMLSSLCGKFANEKRINAYNSISDITIDNNICPSPTPTPLLNPSPIVNSSYSFSPKLLGGQYSWMADNTKFMASGDFNNNGYDDLTMMYDYGNNQMGLWVFSSNGTTVAPILAFQSAINSWGVANTKFMGSGDFNGDGKDDIALIHDYGNNQMGIWTFISNGTTLSPRLAFITAKNTWSLVNTKFMTVGDYNNDGKDDITLLYDYGNNQMGLWTFPSTGSGFASKLVFQTSVNSWVVAGSKFMSSGDYNSDKKDDISILYDYSFSSIIFPNTTIKLGCFSHTISSLR